MALFFHSQTLENFKLGAFVLKLTHFHLTQTKIQVLTLYQVSCSSKSQRSKLEITRQSHNVNGTDVCKVLGKHRREGGWGLGRH